MARILVVSPHPDDEALGMGGTIRRRVNDGDRVEVIFLTSGERGGHGRTPDDTARLREAEAAGAAQILGIAAIEFWREPDRALRAHRVLVERLRGELITRAPAAIYTSHPDEQHPDHAATARVVARAAAAARVNGWVPELWGFEVWTPLRRMDAIEDISNVMEAKLAAIRAYRTQVEALPFDAAFEGLARYRGEMHSWPGGPFAEGFRRLSRAQALA